MTTKMKTQPKWQVLHVPPEAADALRYAKAKLTGETGRTVTLGEALLALATAPEKFDKVRGWERIAELLETDR